MASWGEFEAAEADLAALGRRRLEEPGVVLVGTLRRDGWPRISPVEPVIEHGELYLGMMPGSRKAFDLRRDPRCVVHSAVADRHGTGGDFKVYGRAREIDDLAELDRYLDALEARIHWRPSGPYLCALQIEQVGFVEFGGGEKRVRTWRPARAAP